MPPAPPGIRERRARRRGSPWLDPGHRRPPRRNRPRTPRRRPRTVCRRRPFVGVHRSRNASASRSAPVDLLRFVGEPNISYTGRTERDVRGVTPACAFAIPHFTMAPMSRDSFHRLRQTRAARIVGVYTATAWGVFEIIDKTVRTFGWSEVIPRTSLVLLIVGLVVVTFTAWAYAGQEVGETTGWRWPARIQALLANRWFARVAVGGLGVALLLWGWRMVRPDVRYAPFSVPELRATSEAPRVAVLPVSSSDPRLEQHRRTLLRLLTTDMNDVADMRTIKTELVASRWEESTPVEPKTIARFGRESGVHFVVVPQVERGGEGLRFSAEVLEAGRGESIGHTVVEGREAALDELSDRLSMELYRALVADEGDELLTSPVRAHTSSMHAYKAFLRGERAFRRADFGTALAEYGRATAADSSFALAWFRQGLVRRWEDPAVGPPIESFDNVMIASDDLSDDDRELWRT